MTDEPFDPADLTAQLAPDDEFPPPNPDANDDDGADILSLSVVDRVKAKAKRGEKPPREEKARKPLPPKRAGALVKPLTELYTSLGALVLAADPVCGSAIVANAPECAKRLDALAQENDAVRRALHALTASSAWGGVMIAHLPIMLALMLHHGSDPVRERIAPVTAMIAPDVFNAVVGVEMTEPPGAHAS